MRLYMLEPEVAGEIGENTVYDNRYLSSDKQISKLHFEFFGWLGDDIIESTPCFLVSEKLKQKIEESDLTGYKFQNAEISFSDEFNEIYPNRKIPVFYRLIPEGKVAIKENHFTEWTGEDFLVSEKSYLVVTEKAYDVIKKFNINNCDIYVIDKQK